MGLDIYPYAANASDEEAMVDQMKQEAGYKNPRGFTGQTWGTWYRVFEEITGLATDYGTVDVSALEVHKACIHAHQARHKQGEEFTEDSKKLLRWLEICCEYDARLFFHQ